MGKGEPGERVCSASAQRRLPIPATILARRQTVTLWASPTGGGATHTHTHTHTCGTQVVLSYNVRLYAPPHTHTHAHTHPPSLATTKPLDPSQPLLLLDLVQPPTIPNKLQATRRIALELRRFCAAVRAHISQCLVFTSVTSSVVRCHLPPAPTTAVTASPSSPLSPLPPGSWLLAPGSPLSASGFWLLVPRSFTLHL
jgi:hypothetical protein